MSMSCPEGMLISIQFAQYGRQVPSSEMCPHGIQGDDPSTWNSRSYAARQVALWEDTNCLATTSLTVGSDNDGYYFTVNVLKFEHFSLSVLK